jgi:hypothetical protein
MTVTVLLQNVLVEFTVTVVTPILLDAGTLVERATVAVLTLVMVVNVWLVTEGKEAAVQITTNTRSAVASRKTTDETSTAYQYLTFWNH